MPESFVQVTEGSGKKLHTFQRTVGANNVEDEVVLFGKPYLPVYFAHPQVFPGVATANSHVLQIMAGAAKKVYVRRLVGYLKSPGATTGTVLFSLLRLTSAGTGGTAGVIRNLDPSDPAAGATARHGLTASLGTAGDTIDQQTGIVPNALSTSVGRYIVFDFDYRDLGMKCPIIAAGTSNGVAVSNFDAIASATLQIEALFEEADF